jgi:excisionase family DNA binding protein
MFEMYGHCHRCDALVGAARGNGADSAFKPKPRKPTNSIPENVTPSAMLRLKVAVRRGFPDGSVSAGALRRDPDSLLTTREAADHLNITVEQLLQHVKGGALRYINVGRGDKRPRYRFAPSDLDAFKTSRSTLERACRSSSRKSQSRTTGTASRSNVVGFSARRAALLAAKPKKSKP